MRYAGQAYELTFKARPGDRLSFVTGFGGSWDLAAGGFPVGIDLLQDYALWLRLLAVVFGVLVIASVHGASVQRATAP